MLTPFSHCHEPFVISPSLFLFSIFCYKYLVPLFFTSLLISLWLASPSPHFLVLFPSFSLQFSVFPLPIDLLRFAWLPPLLPMSQGKRKECARDALESVCMCTCFNLYIDPLIIKSKASYILKCVEALQQQAWTCPQQNTFSCWDTLHTKYHCIMLICLS